MAGDMMGIAILGIVLIGGYLVVKQNPDILNNILGKQEEQVAEAPPMESPQEEEQAPEAGSEEPPTGAEADIQPDVAPQYIPVPVVIPQAYEYRFPSYSRQAICSAEFGGSCNSECRHGPTQQCRDCVYFCGQPFYRNYPRPNYRPPVYRPPRNKPSFPRTCDRDEHWDKNEGKCVKNHGGPGPVPGHDCPRGQRYDWKLKKCAPVPTPKPKEDDEDQAPTPTPTPTGPPRGDGKRKPKELTKVSTPIQNVAPTESAYAHSYYGGYY